MGISFEVHSRIDHMTQTSVLVFSSFSDLDDPALAHVKFNPVCTYTTSKLRITIFGADYS